MLNLLMCYCCNSAPSEAGRDWQELKTPPCILDMMLIAVFGCGPVGFEQV